ncbi:MAG: hypothetical protein KGM96_15400 [Acidobacteriota bacterium]|nr:hypothetical protein [Acidobacteriota bacterium]
MKKIAAALALCMAIAVPALAAKHKLPRHPHEHHPALKHSDHRAPRHFHLWPHRKKHHA